MGKVPTLWGAAGAAHVPHALLPHEPADWRQLLHAAPLVARDRRRLVHGRLTGGADGRAVLDHFVGDSHQMQCLAAVAPDTQMSARLLATAPALAARTLAAQRVARWRLVIVVAVFGGPRLQVLDAGHQRLDLRVQHAVVRPQVGILGFQLADAFLCCPHASMLHLHRKSAQTVLLQRHLIADRLSRPVKASRTVDLEQQHRSAGAKSDFMGLDLLYVAVVLCVSGKPVPTSAGRSRGRSGLRVPALR
jgi:hypothetical protein